MKKLTYIFAMAVAGLFLASCSEKEGTTPGNDSAPVVTVYNYAPTSAEYDGDTDQILRFVSNGKVESAYYLVEKSEDKKALIASSGESAYIEKVVSQGTPIVFDDEGLFSTTATDMTGDYDISVVAVNGNKKTLRSVSFSGIAWDPDAVISGTYYVQRSNIRSVVGATSFPATLQRHSEDKSLYRIKGALGPGTKITIKTIDIQGEDSDGVYTFFRIPAQATPYTYGSYGTISVRDVGYWQGDDAWVTSYGYESGMYENGNCFLCIQYYVAAGSLGYTYDYFIAD